MHTMVANQVARCYAYFQCKNPDFGKFWRALQWKMLVSFMAILSSYRPFGIFYGHLVQFPPFWYTFPHFDMLHKEKSGNPGMYPQIFPLYVTIEYIFLKIPPYTPARFDLTTRNTASGDVTTSPWQKF
jgi:hypothetical protein